MTSTLPNLVPDLFHLPDPARLRPAPATHAPRILLLYGSLRERSYSRLLTLEAERLLQAMGAETRVFDPAGLPLPDGATAEHPKVRGTDRAGAVVGRPGMDQPRAPRRHVRRDEGADRLDSRWLLAPSVPPRGAPSP
jgi:hypothetical protein